MDGSVSTEPTPARARTGRHHHEAVVIGAGQAGLATAFYLLRAAAITRGDPDPGADYALGDIVVLPQVRAARDAGDLEATPMFSSLDEVETDQLIWCTGFRPALGPVRHLLTDGSPQVPGLLLVGYGDWTGPGSATITGVGPFAKAAARQAAERVNKTVK